MLNLNLHQIQSYSRHAFRLRKGNKLMRLKEWGRYRSKKLFLPWVISERLEKKEQNKTRRMSSCYWSTNFKKWKFGKLKTLTSILEIFLYRSVFIFFIICASSIIKYWNETFRNNALSLGLLSNILYLNEKKTHKATFSFENSHEETSNLTKRRLLMGLKV